MDSPGKSCQLHIQILDVGQIPALGQVFHALVPQAVVVQVQGAARLVENHVLENRAKAPGGGVNLRLGRGRKADHFGVATAFEVENAAVRLSLPKPFSVPATRAV